MRKRRDKPGPTLPMSMARELQSNPLAGRLAAGQKGKSMFLVSQRKQARKEARKAKKQRHSGGASLAQKAPPVRRVEQPAAGRPAKKPRLAPIEVGRADDAQGVALRKPHAEPTVVKTKFTELLGPEEAKRNNAAASAVDAEVAEQRRLAKKLGIKKKAADSKPGSAQTRGVLSRELGMPDTDDELEAASSALGSEDEGGSDPSSLSAGSEVDADSADGSDEGTSSDDVPEGEATDAATLAERKAAARSAGPTGRYVPPAARAHEGPDGGHAARLRRTIVGLVNRLGDANLPAVTREVLAAIDREPTRAVSDLLAEQLVQAAADGPRATDRFAAVAATFIGCLAARAGAPEIGANFAAQLAGRLEAALAAADATAAANLGLVVAHTHACGLLPAACVFSLLSHLVRRFREPDITLLQLLLRACGLGLRSDDPAAMKDFVVAVHARAAEAQGTLSQRAEVMLDLVLDVKNNRRPRGGSGGGPTGMESLLGQGTLRFVKESRVADVQLQSVTWQTLLQPAKKGMWWLPRAGEVAALTPLERGAVAAEGQRGPELLRLAAEHRMNTDVRRAVFCIVMGSEDYADASERLMRLPLKGDASREVVRVAVECCMREAAFNPYYAVLLGNVLAASKAHAKTAQFCLWDHLRDAGGGTAQRAHNLACLVAELISLKALPVSVLRVAKLDSLASPLEQRMWRTMFERLLTAPKDDAALLAMLKPLSQPQLHAAAAMVRTYLSTMHTDASASVGGAEAAKLRARRTLAQKYLGGLHRAT